MGYLKVSSYRIELRGSVEKAMHISLDLDSISCPGDEHTSIEEAADYDGDGDITDVTVEGWYVQDVVEEEKYKSLQNEHRMLLEDLRKMTNIKQVQKRLKQVKK